LKHILYSQDLAVFTSSSSSGCDEFKISSGDSGSASSLPQSQPALASATANPHPPCLSPKVFDPFLDYLTQHVRFGARWHNMTLSILELTSLSLQQSLQQQQTTFATTSETTTAINSNSPTHSASVSHHVPHSRGATACETVTVALGLDVTLSPRSPPLSPRGRALSASTHARTHATQQTQGATASNPATQTIPGAITVSSPSAPIALPPLPALPKPDPPSNQHLSPKSASLLTVVTVSNATQGTVVLSASASALTSNSARTSPIASPKSHQSTIHALEARAFLSASDKSDKQDGSGSEQSFSQLLHGTSSPNSNPVNDFAAAQFLLSVQERIAKGERAPVHLRSDPQDPPRRKANTQPSTPLTSPRGYELVREKSGGDSSSSNNPISPFPSATNNNTPLTKRSGREALKALEEVRSKEAIEQMRCERAEAGSGSVHPETALSVSSHSSTTTSPTTSQFGPDLLKEADEPKQQHRDRIDAATKKEEKTPEVINQLRRPDGGRNSLTGATPPPSMSHWFILFIPLLLFYSTLFVCLFVCFFFFFCFFLSVSLFLERIFLVSASISHGLVIVRELGRPNHPTPSASSHPSPSTSASPVIAPNARTSQGVSRKKTWFSSDVSKDAVSVVFPSGERKTLGIKQHVCRDFDEWLDS
jgi:hypothetical protein